MSVEIQRHNKRVLASLEPGDAVEFKRGNFAHWALYIGDERVIHLTKESKDGCKQIFTLCGATFDKAFVEEANFGDVARDSKAYKNNSKDLQCRYGVKISEQVQSFFQLIIYGIGVVAAVALMAVGAYKRK